MREQIARLLSKISRVRVIRPKNLYGPCQTYPFRSGLDPRIGGVHQSACIPLSPPKSSRSPAAAVIPLRFPFSGAPALISTNLFASRMSRFLPQRRVQIEYARYDDDDDDDAPENLENDDHDDQGREGSIKLRPSNSNVTEDQEPFMGVKVRRKASRHRDYRGDYIDVPSRPHLMKVLDKQGDKKVIFADRVLKFTGSGKMKRRILLITDFAIYVIDPETDALKRRIALAALEKLCLSELSDNFFAMIIPTEYDILMASTRKTEIVTLLVEAMKSASDYELEVVFSNRFEYNAAADLVKEVEFEEVEGGVKTRIARK